MAKGVILTPQAGNPIPNGQSGIYASSTGDLIQVKQDGTTIINITEVAASSAPSVIKSTFINGSLSTISKGRPVVMNSSGEFEEVDISFESALQTFGITETSINSGASGSIITHGRLEDVTLTAALGDVLYVKPDGSLIGSSEFTVGTGPSVGNDGYVLNDYSIRIGIVGKNLADPFKKDIIVNVQVLGRIA